MPLLEPSMMCMRQAFLWLALVGKTCESVWRSFNLFLFLYNDMMIGSYFFTNSDEIYAFSSDVAECPMTRASRRCSYVDCVPVFFFVCLLL